MKTIYVKDFTTAPGGRYKKFGKGSAEEFRDNIMVPAIKKYGVIIINLDGVMGYSSSFLEEAFADLFRLNEFKNNFSTLNHIIEKIQTANQGWKNEIISYVNDAQLNKITPIEI